MTDIRSIELSSSSIGLLHANQLVITLIGSLGGLDEYFSSRRSKLVPDLSNGFVVCSSFLQSFSLRPTASWATFFPVQSIFCFSHKSFSFQNRYAEISSIHETLRFAVLPDKVPRNRDVFLHTVSAVSVEKSCRSGRFLRPPARRFSLSQYRDGGAYLLSVDTLVSLFYYTLIVIL